MNYSTIGTGSKAPSDPPLLTGGLSQIKELIGWSVDWLSQTVPSDVGAKLVKLSTLSSIGGMQAGFQRSERRDFDTYKAWRKFEPRAAQNVYERDYESWVFSGENAPPAFELLRHADGYPSQIDIAFDLACSPGLSSCDVTDHCKVHTKSRRLKVGIWAEDVDDAPTMYVGSKHSKRRLRIYRKDLEDATYAALYGPVMRIELILKDDMAKRVWAAVRASSGTMGVLAEAHIREMLGVRLTDAATDAPERVTPSAKDAADRVLAFFQQNGATLSALIRAGVPIEDLAERRRAAVSDRTRYRLEELENGILAAGVDDVAELVKITVDRCNTP